MKINIKTLITQNPKIKFLMPIRNPLDVAISNFDRPHKRLLSAQNLSCLQDTVSAILEEIAWFISYKKEYPKNFFSFYQNDLNKNTLACLASFLEITPETRWLTDTEKCLVLKNSYEYSKELKDFFNRKARELLKTNPDVLEKLLI